MGEKLLNFKEACEFVGRKDATLRKAVRNKEIPCRLFRGGYIFSPAALHLWALGMEYEEIERIVLQQISNKVVTEERKLNFLVG